MDKIGYFIFHSIIYFSTLCEQKLLEIIYDQHWIFCCFFTWNSFLGFENIFQFFFCFFLETWKSLDIYICGFSWLSPDDVELINPPKLQVPERKNKLSCEFPRSLSRYIFFRIFSDVVKIESLSINFFSSFFLRLSRTHFPRLFLATTRKLSAI